MHPFLWQLFVPTQKAIQVANGETWSKVSVVQTTGFESLECIITEVFCWEYNLPQTQLL